MRKGLLYLLTYLQFPVLLIPFLLIFSFFPDELLLVSYSAGLLL